MKSKRNDLNRALKVYNRKISMKKESEMETGREREKESLQQQTHNGTYSMLQQLDSKSTARKMFF